MNDRSNYIGASEIADVLGEGYRTPYQLYLIKKGEMVVENNYAMSSGKQLEPLICQSYLKSNNLPLGGKWLFNTDPNEYGVKRVHKDYPFLLCHMDGYNEEANMIIEAKTTDIFINKDKLPTHWLLQVAYECEITGADKADIVVWYEVNKPFHVYHYTANKALQQSIIKRAVNFWENHIVKNVPPPVTSQEDISEMNARLFHLRKHEVERTTIFNEEQIALLNEFKEAKEAVKKAEEKERHLKTRLYENIKDYDVVFDERNEKLLTYKFNSKGTMTINKELLKTKYPDIYEEVTKESVFVRQLRIK